MFISASRGILVKMMARWNYFEFRMVACDRCLYQLEDSHWLPNLSFAFFLKVLHYKVFERLIYNEFNLPKINDEEMEFILLNFCWRLEPILDP